MHRKRFQFYHIVSVGDTLSNAFFRGVHQVHMENFDDFMLELLDEFESSIAIGEDKQYRKKSLNKFSSQRKIEKLLVRLSAAAFKDLL